MRSRKRFKCLEDEWDANDIWSVLATDTHISHKLIVRSTYLGSSNSKLIPSVCCGVKASKDHKEGYRIMVKQLGINEVQFVYF